MGTQVETMSGNVVAKRTWRGAENGTVVQMFVPQSQWANWVDAFVTTEDNPSQKRKFSDVMLEWAMSGARVVWPAETKVAA